MCFGGNFYYWVYTRSVIVVSIVISGHSSCDLKKPVQLMSQDGEILAIIRRCSKRIELEVANWPWGRSNFLYACVISAWFFISQLSDDHSLPSKNLDIDLPDIDGVQEMTS